MEHKLIGQCINVAFNKKYDLYDTGQEFFIITESETLPYHILNRSKIKLEDIEEGHQYTYYEFNGKLYDGFLTTADWFKRKEQEQLSLFDRRDYY